MPNYKLVVCYDGSRYNAKIGIYTGMFLDGKLEAHLKEIGEAAEEMSDRLVDQMKKAEDYRSITDLTEIMALLRGKSPVAFDFETAPTDEWRNDPRAALDAHKSVMVHR